MSADRVRWEHIQRIYEMCNRNVSETARRLNMHRPPCSAFWQAPRRGNVALKLPVPCGSTSRFDPLRGGRSRPNRHQLAGRGRNTMLRRLAMHMRAIGVGGRSARFPPENLARQVLGEGENTGRNAP